jgi:hypothetical protein
MSMSLVALSSVTGPPAAIARSRASAALARRRLELGDVAAAELAELRGVVPPAAGRWCVGSPLCGTDSSSGWARRTSGGGW